MARTPSYLKGLAEARARVAGDLERYESLAWDLNARLTRARDELAARDIFIRKFAPDTDPARISPILRGKVDTLMSKMECFKKFR